MKLISFVAFVIRATWTPATQRLVTVEKNLISYMGLPEFEIAKAQQSIWFTSPSYIKLWVVKRCWMVDTFKSNGLMQAKGKFVPVRHAMKAYRGSGGIVPRILLPRY
jgi:hypothetical protein